MIRFENVTKRYNGVAVIDDVSVEVASGAFVTLVGPSGAGKSTLLRMTNALILPDSGRILFDDEDVTKTDPVALRRRFGYVIQSTGLFPHWTVARNVATVPKLLGWPRQRISDRVDELLAMVDLPPGEYRGRYPAELSGGQQQRVGVARAVVAGPAVLLADEPTGQLDSTTGLEIMALLQRLAHERGMAALVATHDPLLLRDADRVLEMHDGRLRAPTGHPTDATTTSRSATRPS